MSVRKCKKASFTRTMMCYLTGTSSHINNLSQVRVTRSLAPQVRLMRRSPASAQLRVTRSGEDTPHIRIVRSPEVI